MGSKPISKLTPVLFVDRIAPCLPFWTERLGFEKTVEVPGDGRLAFAILQKGGIELMYQTWASLEADAGSSGMLQELHKGQTFLYLEVDSLDETIAALDGVEVVMPMRTAFYGATEIAVKEPGGHFITFAEMNRAG